MKKITKKLFALALVLCGAMSASAANKVVFQYDFDGESPAGPAWSQGTVEYKDNMMVITNTEAGASYSAQACFSAAEPFELGASYTLTFKIRGEEEGLIHALLQYNDGSTYPHAEFPEIKFTTEFQTVKVKLTNSVENAQDFMLQWGDHVGTIYIDDIKLTVYTDKKEVNTGANANLRWTNLLVNGNLEGEGTTSFLKTQNDSLLADSLETLIEVTIAEGVGKDGSKGFNVHSYPNAAQDWSAQLLIVSPQALPAGSPYRLKFDYRSTSDESIAVQSHGNPGEYIGNLTGWGGIVSNNLSFTSDWQTFEASSKVSSDWASKGYRSVALNLSTNKDEDVDFYFDNLSFDVQYLGLLPQFAGHVILLDLARSTNIPELVAATGQSRLVYPEGTVVLTRNGEELELLSVEAYADGRLYAFIDGNLRANDELKVKFTNPEDAKYQIVYTDDKTAIPAYDSIAYYNANVVVDDAIDWEYAAPMIMSINPAEGSFNLPADMNTITVKFDIPASTKDIAAMFGSEKWTVATEEEFATEITFKRTATTPLAQGEYELNIYDIHSETGDDEGYWGDVTYAMTVGLNEEGQELMEDLANALNTAITAKTAAENELYSGIVFNELTQFIDAYDEEYKVFTSPAECRNVVKILTNAAIAMDNHRKIVDNYYATVNGGIKARDAYSESKFAVMDEFVTFKQNLAKYLDANGEAIKLYDPEELQAAVDALSPIVNNASKLFTEGPSKYGTTGIAALVERIRLGAEALKVLGVSEEDELIKAANNALTDDDNLAQQIKLRLKAEIYKALSEGKASTLFAQVYDETLEDIVASTVDMTVFYKNPNIYISNTEVGGGLGEGAYNEEYMPGWTVPEGAITPKYSVGTYNVAAPHLIADGTFLQWQSAFQIEQAVIDLPVGTYTIKSSFSERTGTDMESVFYVTVSSTNPGEFAAVDSVENKGDSPTNDLYLSVEGIQVTDGYLNVGVKAGAAACCHFNAISVQMAGTIEGFDYAVAYKEAQAEYDAFVSGIEGTVITPDVAAFELYDLSGRRINKAQQGVVIIKKYMTDGTVVTEKVIKK